MATQPIVPSVTDVTPVIHQHSTQTQQSTIAQEVQSVAIEKFCDRCDKPAALSCTRCRRVHYCNAECQKTAWATHHKSLCIPIAQPELYRKQDGKGLTPLHYAVLFGKEKTLPLEQLPWLDRVKDTFNKTPSELKHLFAPAPSLSEKISLRLKQKDGEVIPLTQEQFLRLTGFRFKNGYVATPEVLRHLHSHDKASKAVLEVTKAAVATFEKAPPINYLAKEPGMGWGLQAGQDIQEGEIICNLGGELVLTRRTNYLNEQCETSDGANHDQFAGPGLFINDGTPNCGVLEIKNYNGVPSYCVVLAMRPIKQGEFLHLDYGPDHPVRVGKYEMTTETYEEAVKFCREGFFYKPTNNYHSGMMRYILGESGLFYKLHLTETLNVSKTLLLITNRSFTAKIFPDDRPTFYNSYPVILGSIYRILAISKKDRAIIPSILALADLFSQATFHQLLFLMPHDRSLSSDSLPAYQALGELIDHLYLVANGTLSGTYVGKEYGFNGEKMPDIPLDISFIKAKFDSLPPFFQFECGIKERIEMYIKFLTEKQLPEKKEAFIELQNILLQ